MQNRGAIIALVVLAIVAVGAAAFFIGRSNGESRGEDSVRAEYQPGQPAYQAIFNKGRAVGTAAGTASGQAQGEKTGQEKGTKLGLQKGQQQGQVTGANDVFAGFSGGWQTGNFYIVLIDQGTGGVDYKIASRKQMQPGFDYKICVDNSSEVCVVDKTQ